MEASIIKPILEQHIEEAAFLWLQRDAAVWRPHYSIRDVSHLDDRVEAHLDGLRVADEAGWEVCREALTIGGSGEVFAAAVLAFERGDEFRIQEVLEANGSDSKSSGGITSALGWLPCEAATRPIERLVSAELSHLRRIGLAASAIHRRDPGTPLTRALTDQEPLLKARALRAVGELGRKDLLSALAEHLADEDKKCRFYAGWSGALLGSGAGAPVLRDVATAGGPYSERACSMALRRMGVPEGHSWIRELASNPGLQRLAVFGAGAIGDPASIPWLIEHVAVPELARVAGESFSMVTGVDIAYEDLEGAWPDGFEAGPTENPEDEDVALDPDEDLPWPNPELIDQWWSKNKSRFRSGTRYLLGKPISVEQCQHVLRYGYQRQRAAAAIELAMLQPGQPLFEVRAPGFRQQQLLGLKRR
jgi:uncharacterized protein (TIGR02270 family)